MAPKASGQTTDTTAADTTAVKKVKRVERAGHQLCLGVDIARPIINSMVSNSFGYDFAAEYYLRNEFFAEAEGGWGGSKVTYTDLAYNSNNSFFRLGFNKSILARERPTDWDMMFFGMRAGYAAVTRGAASYTVIDSVWGNESGSKPGKSFSAVWAELAAGMRVELFRGISGGWTIRGKFLMNGRSFKDLSPLYIAGYGRGDKNTAFDFNVYLSYAIRWRRARAMHTTPDPDIRK